MTELERVEADVREAAARGVSVKTVVGDPAPSPEELIGKRADELVDQITDKALSELRTLRDSIDAQMKALIATRDDLKAQNRRLVGLASQAIEIKSIADDAVNRLTQSIEGKLITARKANGRSA